MIFGALGLLAGQTVGLRSGLSSRQLTVRGLLSGSLLLILVGFDPDSDVIAHSGGFLAGVLFGALLALWPNRLAVSVWSNRLAELICAGLVILTWRLALR